MHLPSKFKTSIISTKIRYDAIQEAHPPISVSMQLKDEIDISRGEMIVRESNSPIVSNQLEVMI